MVNESRRQSAINETTFEINKAENVNHLKRQSSSANIAIPIIQTSPPPSASPIPSLPLTLPSLPMVHQTNQTHKYSISSLSENKSTNKMNIKTNYCIENDEISTGIENSSNIETTDNNNLLKLTRRTMPNQAQSRHNHLNKCNRQSICKLIDHAHYPKHHHHYHPYDGTLTMNEQIDEYLNQCIEIESNRKLFQANVNWFLLNFRSKEYESMVKARLDFTFIFNFD